MGDNQALAAAPTVALTLRFWRARGSAYLRYVRTILNHVLRGFLCGFGILRHVVEDVVFHEFPHQAVNRSPGAGETVKNFRALLIFIQSLQDRVELSDDLFGSVY